jgi:hypothetical protein
MDGDQLIAEEIRREREWDGAVSSRRRRCAAGQFFRAPAN